MDIQTASINLSQSKVQEQAAVQVQSMVMDMVKEQAVAVEKLINSVQVIADPNLGRNVNVVV